LERVIPIAHNAQRSHLRGFEHAFEDAQHRTDDFWRILDIKPFKMAEKLTGIGHRNCVITVEEESDF
jgi:hypothetical protein